MSTDKFYLSVRVTHVGAQVLKHMHLHAGLKGPLGPWAEGLFTISIGGAFRMITTSSTRFGRVLIVESGAEITDMNYTWSNSSMNYNNLGPLAKG